MRLRAQRLGLDDAPVLLAAETNVSDIIATLSEGTPPSVAVIDSIQTLWSPVIEAAPGTVSQLKAGSEALIRFAKQKGTAVLLVGHVTKDGQIAGPKVVEHMVDAVLYFEGDRGHQFRILRAVKNRFGPTDEIGVFEMSDGGLAEVTNPVAPLHGLRRAADARHGGLRRHGGHPAAADRGAGAGLALAARERRARTTVGWDSEPPADDPRGAGGARRRAASAQNDVYLNVAGGLRVREPAADLAVAAALLSSLTGTVIPPGTAVFGEIALSGAIRPVGQTEARLKEAQKLGLKEAVIAAAAEQPGVKGLKVKPMETIMDLVAWSAAQDRGQRRIA